MYDVRIGRTDLYGIISVSTSNSRDVATYDSIAGSKFSRPKNKNLINYTIEMQLSEQRDYNLSYFVRAKTIFKDFDKMLQRGRPVRLIIYNDKSKLSELVYLERYDKEEKENGVYNVTMKCSEYAEAEVRTTNIPKIKRQGKIPNPPPQAIIKNPVEFAKKVAGASTMGPMDDFLKFNEWHTRDSWGHLNYTDPKTGKTFLGLANIPRDRPVKPIWVATTDRYGNVNGKEAMQASTIRQDSPIVQNAKKTFEGISGFWKGYFGKGKQNDIERFGG